MDPFFFTFKTVFGVFTLDPLPVTSLGLSRFLHIWHTYILAPLHTTALSFFNTFLRQKLDFLVTFFFTYLLGVGVGVELVDGWGTVGTVVTRGGGRS